MDGTGGPVVVGGGEVKWRGWRGGRGGGGGREESGGGWRGEGVERRGWAVPMEGMEGREGRVDGVVEGR